MKKTVLAVVRVDTQRSAGIYAIIEKRKPYNHVGIRLPKGTQFVFIFNIFYGPSNGTDG